MTPIPTVLEASKPPRLNAPTVHRLPDGLTIVAEQIPVEAVNLSLGCVSPLERKLEQVVEVSTAVG
ncbi:hypothetical protein [Thermoleptolyngbya sp. C42_A2020_037]|uniref:hypothetical protein n=1 Tax=Thermoleptolyngbya sp. C42_A2020_037 TaxID=2747799 RepID=UPI0019DC3C8E|nr:hypothetical protein [Thermoleptolyngbya sp. C42_A2020_037]MBF2085956.1 hypothetical protein [Thermoleptolyngbya sp. C42_A2020_037]